MKSVSLSQVIRSHDSYRFLYPIQSWSQLLSLALTLAVGLTLIAALFMALAPTTPVAYIVIPVLAGGLTPLFAVLPARFEVVTRRHPHHFLGTLEESILSMGYSATEPVTDRVRRYRPRARLFRWKESTIAVTVNEHAITVGGPVFALRLLQRKLTEIT